MSVSLKIKYLHTLEARDAALRTNRELQAQLNATQAQLEAATAAAAARELTAAQTAAATNSKIDALEAAVQDAQDRAADLQEKLDVFEARRKATLAERAARRQAQS